MWLYEWFINYTSGHAWTYCSVAELSATFVDTKELEFSARTCADVGACDEVGGCRDRRSSRLCGGSSHFGRRYDARSGRFRGGRC